ncbi:MAG TPA: YfhO family protein [Thermoanaerobaculia bacterium]|nr:YfhO family protein [Thermoanaerobaculia bacterium]
MSERSLVRAIPAGEAVRTAALYAALLLVAFFNIVFQGETLIPGNNYNSMSPSFVPENYGPRVRPQKDFEIRDLFSFANLHDCGSSWWQGEPALELVQRAVLRGEFPLWDPYIGGGTPLAASAVPQLFFPPSLLIALVGNPPWLKDLYSLLLLLTGGFFTYVFLRKHGVGCLGSRAGGIAFLFSGAMIQTAPQFFGQTIIGFPVLLATTAWLLERPAWRRSVVAAIVYAVIALASFPAFLVFAVLLTGLYALLMIVFDGGGAPRRVLIVRLATAVLLALGFVAFYYLPMLSVIQGAAYTRQKYEHVGLAVLQPRVVFQLLSSTLMPGTAEYLHPAVYSGNGNIYYLGISALLLAAAAFGRVFPRPILLPFQIVAAAVLLKIVGVPPIQWLGNLPVLRSLHIAHYSGVVIGFALACAAGIAVDQLVQRRLRIVSTIGAILGGSAALVLLWRISVREGAPASPQYWRWLADFRIVAGFLAIVSLLLILAHLFRDRPVALRALGVAMVALLAAEGITNAVFIRQRRWNYWDHPPRYVRALIAHHSYGRVLPFGTLPANMNSPYSIGSTDSLVPFNSSAYTELHHRYFGSSEESLLRECSVLPSESVLDAFAVDRIAINGARSPLIAQALERGYSSLYADPGVLVIARRSAPRYFLTRDYALKSRDDAFHALNERPARQLFLETRPSFPPDPAFRADAGVRVERFRLNSYRLRVSSPAPALLSASEAHYPGWTAKINGKPVPILVANYAFRAVEVPAGHSVVDWSYWPLGMTAGIVLSALALLAAITIWITGR